MKELFLALCLLAVIEGLFLFAFPRAWKRLISQLLAMPEPALRAWGGAMLAIGLGTLWWLRHP